MATYNSVDEIIAATDSNGIVSGEVVIPLIDIVFLDLDSFYDRLADLLVGDRRLNEIDFDVIGTEDNDCVVLRVTGNATDVIDNRLFDERVEVVR